VDGDAARCRFPPGDADSQAPRWICLWQSQCTDYSVASSPWLDGKGDVVEQFVAAAHQANIRVGWRFSPLDRTRNRPTAAQTTKRSSSASSPSF